MLELLRYLDFDIVSDIVEFVLSKLGWIEFINLDLTTNSLYGIYFLLAFSGFLPSRMKKLKNGYINIESTSIGKFNFDTVMEISELFDEAFALAAFLGVEILDDRYGTITLALGLIRVAMESDRVAKIGLFSSNLYLFVTMFIHHHLQLNTLVKNSLIFIKYELFVATEKITLSSLRTVTLKINSLRQHNIKLWLGFVRHFDFDIIEPMLGRLKSVC
jgi:hypothetical protein